MVLKAKHEMRLAQRNNTDGGGEAENPNQSSQDPKRKTRAFHCQFCVREFLRKEHLQRHERLHTKEKPFRCTVCSRTFTRSDLLARHLRTSHINVVSNHCDPELSNSHREESSRHASNTPTTPNSMPVHTVRAQSNGAAYRKSTVPLPKLPLSVSYIVPSLGSSSQNDPAATICSSGAPLSDSLVNTSHIPWTSSNQEFGDFALFIDSMSTPYPNSLSTTFVDQPIFPFSPSPLFSSLDFRPSCAQWEDPNTFSIDTRTTCKPTPQFFDEFSSTFPSFETSSSLKSRQEPWKITQQDWGHLLVQTQPFIHVAPPEFTLPSRHTMTRYIATYFSGFHRHLPFLHVSTFSPLHYPVELILVIAAIGAQYSFDNGTAVMLFRTSHAIMLERLRCRRAELCTLSFSMEDRSLLEPPPTNLPWLESTSSNQELPPGSIANSIGTDEWDPLSAARTLLLLMAMATWGNSKAIFNEAVGLQNILTNLVREEKFLEAQPQTPHDMTWYQWIHMEGVKRTVAIIFCFLIFHTIVYDTPPPILNSELNIYLPSRETDWAARSEDEWLAIRKVSESEPLFRSCFSFLFSKQTDESNESPKGHSSLGEYTLILALIQHIYFLRQMSKCKPGVNQSISSEDVAEVEQALRCWKTGWYSDPESSLAPGSPRGPISFNSTALLRMAYIRLNVDVGPWRTLNTHDPHAIANSMYQSPHLELTHKLTRTVLYSAHALSIPVKIGVNIVARNQAFIWSHQHALCAIECAFVLSKWLLAVQRRIPDVPLDEDESRLLTYIVDMVSEADPKFCPAGNDEVMAHLPDLCSRVIKIWASLLSGEAIWDVPRMIGKAMEAYGQMLEGRSTI